MKMAFCNSAPPPLPDMMRPTSLTLLFLAALLPAQIDLASRPRRAERSRPYDVLHYKIRLKLDQAQRSFDGETQITLRPLSDRFETLVLDAETFRVTAVDQHQFTQSPGQLTIRLARPYRYHEQFTVTIRYRAENVAIDPERYGMPPGYGLGLTFKPATAHHPALVHTLSFPEGARHWFPCYDHPNDKASSEVIATVATGNQVISNGVLKSVTEDAGRREKTFHWLQEQPHSTYLYVLAVGPYVQVTDPSGKLPVSYWVYPQDQPHVQRTFGQTRAIISFLERELGYAYPWPKYDQIALPDFGGGAESTNATVIGDGTLHDAKADKDFPSHWLIAHEAAHQWWGDLLTMRDWSHTWLNESFATYYEYLYMKHLLGEDEGALNLLAKQQAYLHEARDKYQRPIVYDRWAWPNDNFDRHTYQKGGVVLAMLRSVLGDEPFRRSITHYLRRHAFGSVDTHDFQLAIREATGQNVDWFFEQWIYRAGHPRLNVSYSWDGRAVQLRVQQKSVYRLPVAIAVTTVAGKQLHRIELTRPDETFPLPSAAKPLLVHFDEGNLLLKELTFAKSTDELLYQLSHDDVIGRLDAIAALRSQSTNAAVATALRQSATQDPQWAVRRDATLAVPSDAAFLRTRSLDPVSAVRVAALKALGDRRDASLADFFEQRFRTEDSYLAQAEAVRALGKCGARSPLLREAAAMASPQDVVAKAARAALEAPGR